MELTLLIGQLLLRFGPDIAALYASIAGRKEPPSQADWDEFFARVSKAGDSYFTRPPG